MNYKEIIVSVRLRPFLSFDEEKCIESFTNVFKTH